MEVQITVAIVALLAAITLPSLPRLAGNQREISSPEETLAPEVDSKSNRTAGAIRQLDQAVLGKMFSGRTEAPQASHNQ